MLTSDSEIIVGNVYKRADGVEVIACNFDSTMFKWPTGSVSGFGTWGDLRRDMADGKICEIVQPASANQSNAPSS